MNVSAVLVTRGDVDLRPALAPLERLFDDVIVWDNNSREDLHVYGRYAAIGEARHEWVYTQDDDAVRPAREICRRRRAGRLVVNVPPGEHPWLAWGAIFPRSLPGEAFGAYQRAGYDLDAEFRRWSDIVFAHYTGWHPVDLGREDLEWAFADDRMYRQWDHYSSQAAMRERVAAIRRQAA